MHCLAVIRPLGTARQSIELEESATPEHLLQPGRVVFFVTPLYLPFHMRFDTCELHSAPC